MSNYSSKNFDTFINSDIKLDYVITVCNNANNEVCPIWPDKNQIIHWDIEDPVKKFNEDNDATNQKKIFNDTYQTIFKKIENSNSVNVRKMGKGLWSLRKTESEIDFRIC